MNAAAIILAAGASTRMGTSKAGLLIGSETFVERQSRVFREAGIDAIVVGPGGVPNPDPSRGMLSSLQCGLAAVDDPAFVLFTPVDVPRFAVDTVRDLIACEAAPVVIPEYRGKGGHPVRISAEVCRALLRAPATANTRDELRRFRTVHLPVNDPAVIDDVDTPADYAALSTGSGAE